MLCLLALSVSISPGRRGFQRAVVKNRFVFLNVVVVFFSRLADWEGAETHQACSGHCLLEDMLASALILPVSATTIVDGNRAVWEY